MKRADEFGIELDGTPGKSDSMTDVAGVEVGHETLVFGEGMKGSVTPAVRTGVTAILPAGRKGLGTDMFCGLSVLNGNGEWTGSAWVEESGMLSGPVMLTNTYSVGVVRDAVLKWMNLHSLKHDSLPVVFEIHDGKLSDIRGHHVSDKHVFSAIDNASTGGVAEGNVGGGTGAVCYGFKGGVGSASRVVSVLGAEYTVGVIVQANHGLKDQLRINGVPVGRLLGNAEGRYRETGSIVIAIATDAPLLPHQLKRLSRRAFMGVARTGSISSDGSGDFSIAFSVSKSYEHAQARMQSSEWIPNSELDLLFEGAVQATEESTINALLAAESMYGIDGNFIQALPHDRLSEVMRSERGRR